MQGPLEGVLYDHFQLQPIVTVADDGLTANGRWRLFLMTGVAGSGSGGNWGEGIYENEYVKENGVWKIRKLHWYATFVAPYEGGWLNTGRQAVEDYALGRGTTPDRPSERVLRTLPRRVRTAVPLPEPGQRRNRSTPMSSRAFATAALLAVLGCAACDSGPSGPDPAAVAALAELENAVAAAKHRSAASAGRRGARESREHLRPLRRQVSPRRRRRPVRARRRRRNPGPRRVHRPGPRPRVHAQSDAGQRRAARRLALQPHAPAARRPRVARRRDGARALTAVRDVRHPERECAVGRRHLRERVREAGRRLEARLPARLSNVLHELRGRLGETRVGDLRAVRSPAAGPAAIRALCAVSGRLRAAVPLPQSRLGPRRSLQGSDVAGHRKPAGAQ